MNQILPQFPEAFHHTIHSSMYSNMSDTGQPQLVIMAASKGTAGQKINECWEKLDTVIHASAFTAFGQEFAKNRPG